MIVWPKIPPRQRQHLTMDPIRIVPCRISHLKLPQISFPTHITTMVHDRAHNGGTPLNL